MFEIIKKLTVVGYSKKKTRSFKSKLMFNILIRKPIRILHLIIRHINQAENLVITFLNSYRTKYFVRNFRGKLINKTY